MLVELQGRNPTKLQLLTTYLLFIATVLLVILYAGNDLKSIALAIIAGDWTAGMVANAAVSTRLWWRDRLSLRRVFLVVHLLEIPLVWWLCSSNHALFGGLMLVLFAKLSIFLLGRESASGET